jgi:hypothetical protein
MFLVVGWWEKETAALGAASLCCVAAEGGKLLSWRQLF